MSNQKICEACEKDYALENCYLCDECLRNVKIRKVYRERDSLKSALAKKDAKLAVAEGAMNSIANYKGVILPNMKTSKRLQNLATAALKEMEGI